MYKNTILPIFNLFLIVCVLFKKKKKAKIQISLSKFKIILILPSNISKFEFYSFDSPPFVHTPYLFDEMTIKCHDKLKTTIQN
jgi:hypothetical protein